MSPPYNHTRGDSPLTPCPECVRIRAREAGDAEVRRIAERLRAQGTTDPYEGARVVGALIGHLLRWLLFGLLFGLGFTLAASLGVLVWWLVVRS